MTIRDADRFKDKVEVSLDSRQIFFLFFGGAVVACLVFVLGVMVGKRLEARDRVAKRAGTSASMDPLAALDELSADEQAQGDDLAFPTALTGAAREPLGAADTAPAVTPPKPAPSPPAAEAKPAEAKPAEAKPAEAKPVKADGKKKFTLQISSFQDKAEADSFVAKLRSQGYKPFIVTSEVPDRGIFYRVRIGEYASHEDALEAKSTFEKKEHIIAYVTRL
jgi:cell division septation protein DedD